MLTSTAEPLLSYLLTPGVDVSLRGGCTRISKQNELSLQANTKMDLPVRLWNLIPNLIGPGKGGDTVESLGQDLHQPMNNEDWT